MQRDRQAEAAAFARWDQLALMRASRDMREIRGLVRQALEPDMLAPDQFPTMHFTGRCQPGGLAGTLTMHGVSQPVSFVMHRTASGFTAWGALRRQDFGIDGLPHLVGSQVRIKLTAPMPPAFTTAPP